MFRQTIYFMKNNKNNKKANLLLEAIGLFHGDNFLYGINWIQGLVSKVLALSMIFIIIVSVGDLIIVTIQEFLTKPVLIGHQTLFKLFGLFLDVLIALEILENITAYLHKHVVQMELVIITALVAVARKIIIFDIKKSGGFDLIGLAIAILALSISYWIVKTKHSND